MSIERLEITPAGLVVGSDSGSSPAVLSWRWVRDHGEDPASFDATTGQRRVNVLGGDEPLAATGVMTTSHGAVEVVAFEWPEAPVDTWITVATLKALLGGSVTASAPVSLWSTSAEAQVQPFDFDDAIASDDTLGRWLGDAHRFGYALLSGYRGGHDAVEALAARVGYARRTIFGSLWDLSADLDEHDDTAYSTSFLAPHTDGTYSHDAPGLQIFCCDERTGTGGESILVDGFAAAELLRAAHPEQHQLLTQIAVPGHYIEPGVELRTERPALRLNSAGELVQVSLNNYDRSPMLLDPDEMAGFYEAYGHFSLLTCDESRWASIRLDAGDVLLVDNWRVLHGRQAYTGRRRFVGCYLNHEDFESRCRTLGIFV